MPETFLSIKNVKMKRCQFRPCKVRRKKIKWRDQPRREFDEINSPHIGQNYRMHRNKVNGLDFNNKKKPYQRSSNWTKNCKL